MSTPINVIAEQATMDNGVVVEIVETPRGHTLTIGSTRMGIANHVAGPKNWSDGKVTHRFIVKADDVAQQLRTFGPSRPPPDATNARLIAKLATLMAAVTNTCPPAMAMAILAQAKE